MSKWQGILSLIFHVLALPTFFLSCGWAVVSRLPELWGDISGAVRHALPLSLSDNQVVLFAAIITAGVGLIGNWASKSRDFRERRADRLAEAAVTFYTHELTLFRMIKSGSMGSGKDVKKRLDEWQAECQEKFTEANRMRLDPTKSSDDVTKRFEQLKELVKNPPLMLTDLRAGEAWFEDNDLALEQFRMHAPNLVSIAAFRLSIALMDFLGSTEKRESETEARKEMRRFLRHTMRHVAAMRRPFPWRIARTMYEFIGEWWQQIVSAWRAIRNSDMLNAVEGDGT